MSLTPFRDGRCLVWWNDGYARHLPIGLMRDEAIFSDFFEAYNSKWHDLTADEGGQWGGVPSVISDTVPLAVVLRTIFRFLLYSGQDGRPRPSNDDAAAHYDRLVAAGQAEIADNELAMPPWVRDQEIVVWETVYVQHGASR